MLSMENEGTKKDREDVDIALKTVTREQLANLSKSKLIELYMMEQDLRVQIMENKKEYIVEGRAVILKKMIFSPSTEKFPKAKKKKRPSKVGSNKGRNLKPSDRYPDAEIEDFKVELGYEDLVCTECNSEMEDTGLTEVTETLKVIPKKYIIERHHHVKYRCKCCQKIETTPRVPRIKPGSSYSDSMIIDVSLSKYHYLIPMERYCSIAATNGVMGLPPNSLIELTHYLSEFLNPVINKIEQEVLSGETLYADETPQRMMEQASKKNWYLWGYSTKTAAYFECHSSRSGDIAAEFLERSSCLFLMSDAYPGYSKGIRISNKNRADNELIKEIFCNAHARRKFVQAQENPESEFFLYCYRRIYFLEKNSKDPRPWQKFYFEVMKKKAEKLIKTELSRSAIHDACKYFLNHYDGLSLFLAFAHVPLDNNHQERLLRSPVIGRKTWFGTHSILGARTAARLFTVVQSCKLNQINPRVYIEKMVENLHMKKEILSPFEAKRDFPQIFSLDSPPQKTS